MSNLSFVISILKTKSESQIVFATFVFLILQLFVFFTLDSVLLDPLVDLTQISGEFISGSQYLNPEAKERNTYIIFLLFVPFSAMVSNLIVSNIKFCSTKIKNVFDVVLLIVIVVIFTLVVILSNETAYATAIIQPLILQPSFVLLTFLFATIFIFNNSRLLARHVNRLDLIIAIFIGAFISIPWKIIAPGDIDVKLGEYFSSLPAVIYSFNQSRFGIFPIIDFPSQYGFLSIIISPLWKLIGLNVYKFTVVMSMLHFVSIFSILIFLKRVAPTRIEFYSYSISLIYVFQNFWLPENIQDHYYQYYPIRTLFPAISLLVVDKVLSMNRMSILFVGFFSAVALIVNIDSGFVTLLSLLGMIVLVTIRRFFLYPNVRLSQFSQLFFYVLGISLPLIVAYTFIAHNSHPDNVSSPLEYQNLFYISGFMMLPLPRIIHFWHILFMVPLVGFCIGICNFISTGSKTSLRLLHLSILTLGLFAYFQGRSHEYNLLFLYGWVLLNLITIFSFLHTKYAYNEYKLCYRLYLRTFIFSLSFSIGLCAAYNFPVYFEGFCNFINASGKNRDFAANTKFVGSVFKENPDCLFISLRQGLYLTEAGYPYLHRGPGMAEIVLNRDVATISNEINNSTNSCIIVGSEFYPKNQPPFLGTELAQLDTKYELTSYSEDGSLALWLRR